MMHARVLALFGSAALACCFVGHDANAADVLVNAAGAAEVRPSVDMARLTHLARFQEEFASFSSKSCDAGNVMSCESADGAKLVLDRFEGALALCNKGDREGCASAESMAPDIATNENFACENVKLASCPVNNEAVSTDEAANPEAQSSTILTPVQGPVVYQGEPLSSGEAQGPIPGVPTGATPH
jgi:hypothetical protein